MKSWGLLDFAGGTVVEINSGVAGLITALFLGKRLRINYPTLHNLPFVVLGAALLWFGWLGFNAGSALAANGVAVNAFISTNTAAAAAAVTWAMVEWMTTGKPTIFGSVTGAVAGLVAITPSCGFVNFTGALITGGVIGVLSYFAISYFKPKFGYDDSLDAFGVHAVGGFWGIIAVGLLATVSVNSAGGNGLFNGNSALLFSQLKCAAFAIVYCAGMTGIVCWVTNKIIPMRVSQENEIIGLDLSQHHERAYTILD